MKKARQYGASRSVAASLAGVPVILCVALRWRGGWRYRLVGDGSACVKAAEGYGRVAGGSWLSIAASAKRRACAGGGAATFAAASAAAARYLALHHHRATISPVSISCLLPQEADGLARSQCSIYRCARAFAAAHGGDVRRVRGISRPAARRMPSLCGEDLWRRRRKMTHAFFSSVLHAFKPIAGFLLRLVCLLCAKH